MLQTKSDIKSAEFSAQIIRADGSVEDLGVISRYERPTRLKQVVQTFIQFFKGK